MADEIYIVEDFETEEDRLPLYAGMENLLKTAGKKTEYQIWRWGEKKDAEGTIEQGKNRTP